MANQSKFILAFCALAAVLLFNYCSFWQEEEETPYRNLTEEAHYVGSAQCRSCHGHVHETYQHTGMGLSFDSATLEKSSGVFGDHVVIHDSSKNLSYKPYWEDGAMKIKEYRMEEGELVHSRTETIAYIIGSGQHTNSHMVNFNGYVYQAPITFYTQDEKWDLAPGYENGYNSRFGRLISLECMSCHNGFPSYDFEAENRYHEIAKGIDCERCHGPGSIHLEEKLASIHVDTATGIDYTIVNPADLSKELVMDLCQRCHLQGITVLHDSTTFFDFKPGMRLGEVMNVFLPRFTGDQDRFIMASQADRLQLSACYNESEMTCITCHNPHVSVKQTSKNTFNLKCQSCHSFNCSESLEKVEATDNDCISCHMPRTGSIDIPHVTITDHFIRKDYGKQLENVSSDELAEITEYMYLECMTDDNPSNLEMAQGYLTFYEKFNQQVYLLDSAKAYLDRAAGEVDGDKQSQLQIYHSFLREDYAKAISYVQADITYDAWTYYRIGESHNQIGDYANAIGYLNLAVEIKPKHLDFLYKLGTMYVKTRKMVEAQEVFEQITMLQPKYEKAWYGLALTEISLSNFDRAENYLNEALNLNPDYTEAIELKNSLLAP